MSELKETKELVKFVIEIGEAIDKSLENGTLGFEDVSYFISAMMTAGPAFDDISLIPTELKVMDPAKAQELVDFVKQEFDIAADKVEAVIEKALSIGVEIYNLINLIKA